ILRVELQLVVAEETNRARTRLGKAGKVAEQRAGIGHTAIVGTVRRICGGSTIAEAELAVRISPGDLVFTAALVENAELHRVVVLHPAQVVIEVDGRVGLEPRIGAKVRPRK